LNRTAHQLAASAYQKASPGGQHHGFRAAGSSNPTADSSSKGDEEIVDAQYEEVG